MHRPPMFFEETPLFWTVSEVLSAEECQQLRDRAEVSGFEPASMNTAFRNSERAMWDDPLRAMELFRKLMPHLPEEMEGYRLTGLNERLRILRYQPGQQFAPHTDHWFHRGPEISLLTLLLSLNDDFLGGETIIEDERADFFYRPVTGSALIFQHKLNHVGNMVIHGAKWLLRTDVMYQIPVNASVES